MMILLPQLFMLDFSIRANVPPPKFGTEEHYYTLDHYKYMVFGSAQSTDSYNVIDLTVFFRTIVAAIFVTLIDVALCYPIAYYLAHVAIGGWSRLMVLSLIVPFWVNEILRAFAFKIIFGSTGVINNFLVSVGNTGSAVRFHSQRYCAVGGLELCVHPVDDFPNLQRGLRVWTAIKLKRQEI